MLKIGVTTRIVNTLEYHEVRDAISHDLIDFIFSLSAKPIIIPNNVNYLVSILSEIDILVISGGNDLSSVMSENHDLFLQSKLRDKVENRLIELSIAQHIPVIGICRGMQIINEYFGGTLKKLKRPNIHSNGEHKVFFEEKVFEDLEGNELLVNSYHNYCIDSIGKDLIPVAFSDDKEIELMKHKVFPIYGMMWHPERKSPDLHTEKFNTNLLKKIIQDK